MAAAGASTSQSGSMFSQPAAGTSIFKQESNPFATASSSKGGGLFSSGPATNKSAGLFGSNSVNPLPNTNLFAPQSTGLFSQNAAQQPAGAAANPFSAGRPTANPFTSGTSSSTGLFGSSQPSSGGLFGNSSSAGNAGLFGSSQSTGLFTTSSSTAQGMTSVGQTSQNPFGAPKTATDMSSSTPGATGFPSQATAGVSPFTTSSASQVNYYRCLWIHDYESLMAIVDFV